MQWSLVLPVPTVDRPWSGLVAPLRLEDGHAVEIKLLNMDLSAKVSGFPYVTCSGTLYLAEVTFDGTSITLSGTDDTRFVPEEPMQPHGWHRVKELCAGLGGIGYGLQFLQAVICASVEINDLACSQLAHNLHGEIIQGDICQDQTILACHLAGGTSPALLTAGFPCQPFSSQGDQKAFADERTKPFWAILRATILTRATGLILECVPQAGRNSVIIDSLQEVARLLHWQVHPVQLSLSDVWPSSRTRWWCLLLPQALGDPELRSWHADGHGACINKVLEDWPIWDEADERELELTAFEIDKYFDSSLGPDQRILDMNKTCPTALHSYGNALQHCPCGCRPPFRADRLERAGLRGFCVKSKRTGNLRFLHPNELSYLLSYAPAADFVRPCRAALCLLGQIAAPAQALWVYAHACRTFEMHQNGFATTDPQASLDSFRQRLSCQKHDYWTFSSSLSTSAVELVDADGTAIPCTRQGLTHVGHLLAAEESSTSWGYMPKLYDGSRLVPSDAVLQLQGLFGPYVLLRVAKAQPKPAPTGLLAIAIDIPEHFHIALVPVGTFLFEVLHDFGLSGVPSLQDDFGHTLLPGHRLWHSTRLMLSASVAAPILSVADTPCLRPDISVSSAHSLGFGQHGLGLCIDFVWDAAHFLLDQFVLLCPDRRSNTRIGIVRTHPGQAMYFDYGESFIARPRPRNTYYWMVLEDEHWYLIVCYLEGSQFDPVHHAATFYIYDGLRHGVLPDSAQRLIHLVECMWFYPVEEVYHAGILEQTRTDSCGTLMLGHLVHALGLCRDPCLDHIEDLHPGLAFLSAAYPLQRLGFGPSSANSEGRLQHELELLLLDKGVPHARVAERAAMAIQKIGVAGLQEALSRPNAWAALKSLGSRPHTNFMFVKSDELQDKIRQRAAAKFKIQPSTKKARQGTSVNSKPSLQVEPDHLSLIPGTFAADDKEVSQISFAEVGQDKTGLAFCHAVDIQPYLIEGKPISTQALGVLTITPVPTELRGLLAVVDLRYPALCTATSEPMLISGSLINLGQVPIGRLGVTNPPQVGHLVHALGLCRDPCLDHIEDLHPGLAFLSAAYPLQRLGFGPSSANSEGRLQHELELLLLDKGVPHARVAERAAMAIQKIGVAGLQEALSRPNAWAALKSLGSRPHTNFMFVKSDELQDKIRQRAAAKFKIQPSTKKARQGTSVNSKPSLQVEPDHLSLIPGTFAADDKEVSQISFAEVGQDKTGLAFCHAVDIQPYLIEGKPISTQALGVLTITPVPTELRGLLAVVDLRYPALCTATSEPMLISGSLINLGQVPIGRLGVTNPPQVAAIKTQTLKLTVYKDQWPDDWTQFIDKPFRLLLAKFPRLQLCRSTGCGDGCAFYHPPVDEVLDSLILDLWGRNWHLDNGKYTKPEQASYWSILIRVPHYAHLTVQGLSGTHGLYCEPRTHGGKEVDPTFSIVWLNNVGLQQILHRAKTTAKVVAIHRLQQKYGLRFAEADFAEAHKLLKPEEPYVHSRTTSIYKLFPLPLGTQRQGLQRALLQWGWKARVLQPVAGSVDGTTWEVGAAQEPPSRVLQSADGDVMVTFLRHTIKDPAPAPIVASSSTRDHFKQLSMAKDDPWLGQSDPWKAYRSTASSTAAPSTDKLKQMEERLRADLHSAVHAPSAAPQGMHVDSEDSGLLQSHQLQSESRLHALEVDMEEIKNSNQQFRVWFQQAADQNQELQTHVASVQAVVEQQQRDFDQLRSDMAVHTSSTQEQMNVLRGEVREEFSNGFSRIEAMLEKKARTS